MTPTQIIEWNRRRVGYAPDPSIEMPGADEPKTGGLASEPLTLTSKQIECIKSNIGILYRADEVTQVGN